MKLYHSIALIIIFIFSVISCSPKTSDKCIKRAKWTYSISKTDSLYAKAIDLDSTNIEAWYYLAWRNASSKDTIELEKSRNCFTNILQIDSMQDVAWYGLGYTYTHTEFVDTAFNKATVINSDDLYRAVKFITKAIEIDSNQWIYYYQRGYAYNHLPGEDSLAYKDFQKSCELGNSVACSIIEKW